jgi:adenylate cyclase
MRLCAFSRIQRSRAAGDMQSGICDANDPETGLPFGPIQVKIGLHYATLLIETDDVFGETVNIAARMAKLAKPDQIMTTEPIVWKLPDSLRGSTHFVDAHTFEERSKPRDLYEILWEFSEVTDVSGDEPPKELRIVHTTLTLISRVKGMVLNEDRPHITIGRSETNELIIANPLT